jgi:adenylosuccinate lyase
MKEALEKIRRDVKDIQGSIKTQALKYKMTPVVGRTHGVHAEPITFGVKLLVWYEEFKRHLKRIDLALEHIGVGRIAGSVGTYIHLDPEVERIALKNIGLKIANVSTQILQRDRHAEVISVLALICTTLDKIATEIRHLQKTEVLEIEETFTKGQKGSSSMPHKRNPVRCERISGLARITRSNLQTALENIPLWHERDISHSSAERIIVPDSFIITDYLLHETSNILQKWHVYPERMTANIDRTRGLVFSQMVLTALTKKEISREKAYEIVQRNSLEAWNKGGDFKDLLKADKEVSALLSDKEIDACFSLEPYMSKIDFIFDRVLKDAD